MKIIAIIPARGGSKGVPGKNMKILAGQHLIDHTILFAKESKVFHKIVVSSDDDKICSHSIKMGVDVIKRPSELAQDGSLVIDAIRYTIKKLEETDYFFDFVFLLEPTAPIRSKEDLLSAVSALKNSYDSVATFCEIDTPIGRIWKINDMKVEPLLSGSDPFLPRQKQPLGYRATGQIYGFKRKNLKIYESNSILQGKVFPLITNPTMTVDIDTEFDFLIAEYIIKMMK